MEVAVDPRQDREQADLPGQLRMLTPTLPTELREPRRSPKVDHFCSDRVDHVENTRCHVARHGERRFITPAAGA